jgi:hypothetical protein
MSKRLALAVLLLALAGPALAAPNEVVTNPVWTDKPDGGQMAGAYPDNTHQASGRATLQCRVKADGRLTGCKVLAETPAGLGFGKATVTLGRYFRMEPIGQDGKPVGGKLVRIPIVWRLPSGDTSPLSYAVGDGANLVTIADRSALKDFACPSSKDAQRRCVSHPIVWESRPTLDDTAPAVLAVGQAEGVSQLNCGTAPDGALTDCRAVGDVPEKARAAMLAFTPLFKAPAAAVDGTTLTAGRLFISFDWATLTQAARIAVDP